MEQVGRIEPDDSTDIFSLGEESYSLDDILSLGARIIEDVAKGNMNDGEAKQKLRALIREASGSHHLIEGIHNKRWFSQRLEEEINRSRREKSPLTIISMDLDGFKAVNDQLGHLAGDKTLKDTGAILLNVARRSIDSVAGMGGDEFAILLPATNSIHSLVVAIRILKTIPSISPLDPETGKVISLTASIGVTEFSENETAGAFLERADRALYRAKQGGKNAIGLDTTNDPQFNRQKLETILEEAMIEPRTKAQTIKDILDYTILVHK